VNKLALCKFRLSGNWAPLLGRLPKWRQRNGDMWTDGLSEVHFCANDSSGAAHFGFVVFGQAHWSELLGRLDELDRSEPKGQSQQNKVHVATPSGVTVGFERAKDALLSVGNDHVLFMNHIALNVTRLDAERAWYESLFRLSAVLARAAAWEPVSQSYVRDAHLFHSPSFYITLRETDKVSNIDHVGWMTRDKTTVDEMAELVKTLGWTIIFGPAAIDGSYLFHFVGPDDRVHDFFFPTDFPSKPLSA
jgi:hypothetical protein